MSTPPTGSPATDRPYRLEQIDDAAVVQLYADGFAELSLDEKMLVWHLYLAALAGRDIYYDQRYRHNLAMRDILEEIVAHRDGIPAQVLAELTRYTKLFWINTGPYNNLTARKFVLDLSTRRARWPPREHAARERRAVPAWPRARSLDDLIARYAPMFFDLAVDPMVTCKTPGRGATSCEASANNLYDGVTMADLDGVQRALPAQLARRQERRSHRRGGLSRRRPLRRRDSGGSSASRARRCRSRRRRSRRRCGR